MSGDHKKNSWLSKLMMIAIGLLGAALVWVVTPFNNYVLGNSNISDSYLPPIVLFLTLILVLGVNPLLRWLAPSAAMSARQLALAIGIMLIACVLPGQGLLRATTFSLAKTTKEVSEDKPLAAQYDKMRLPADLFPDKLGYNEKTPVSEGLLEGISSKEPIPWSAWVRPLLGWGVLLLFAWMMMIGLGMIVFPQWRHNERLAFPLLTLQQSLIQDPDDGRLFAPVFRLRSFWIAAGAVFAVYLLYGGSTYFPETVPALPLSWDVSSLVTDGPLRQLPGYMRFGRFYFLFVGLAFFMPTRISFSIWFFVVVYGLYRAFAPLLGITAYTDKTDDQRLGAVLLLAPAILWVGRSHWARVIRSMVRPGRRGSPDDAGNRRSGYTFLIGLAGMFGWLLWTGVQPGWAAMLVGFAFLITLMITRIVAETGMPFVRLYEDPLSLMRLAPIGWIGAASLYMAVMFDVLFSLGSRVNPAAMATHVIGLDDELNPKRRANVGLMLIGSLAMGLVIAGAANLWVNYRHGVTLDGQPIHLSQSSELRQANDSLRELDRGELSEFAYNRYAHFAFGAGLAGTLYYLCMTLPKWPLHPFGMMLIDSHYGHTAFASIFVGWLLQTIVVRFGGARLYRLAQPVFLGIIIGEVLAAIFWALVPIALAAANLPFKAIHIMPT